MQSTKLALVAAAVTLPLATPASATEDDLNVWTGQFVTIDLGEDSNWYIRGEAQERFTNDADRLGQLLLRSFVGYRITDKVNIGGGYAYILTDPVGPAKTNEHRFYQELNVRLIEKDGVTLDSRTRLEQRTFEEGDGTSWRFRNFVQLRVPITENNKLNLYTEPFIELNDTQFQSGGLSVWRNFVGVTVPLGDGITMVPGYLNQTVFREGRENRMDHVANVNVFFAF
ncbi:DUF2490 domain-containing protein [Erythrobacter sp. SCSIO 43205]|uniref:DUF2490 domain-containing protein n=1 Tax=Erythrobacter sp. SCSIO 43205 TaxID=2779361 RepID=UPI001CA7C191|nr:DUF2490 domain-containing protein [Erythrobacter sp. SCSIO 43205]UAB77646.1 DUF2490 domain-containing protein [Erythrobacter sp. SCSIO 43205]